MTPPKLSFTGTQATMQGWPWSRSSTCAHSRFNRSSAAAVCWWKLGISLQTRKRKRSAQYSQRESSTFWCLRAPLKPISLVRRISYWIASSDGGVSVDCGQ